MYSLLSYFFRNWLTLVGGTSFYQPWWSWRSPLQCYHCLCKLASKIQGILRLRSDTQLSIDTAWIISYCTVVSPFVIRLTYFAVLYVLVQWIIYALKLTLIIIQLAPWLQETVIILLKMVTHSFPRNHMYICTCIFLNRTLLVFEKELKHCCYGGKAARPDIKATSWKDLTKISSLVKCPEISSTYSNVWCLQALQ